MKKIYIVFIALLISCSKSDNASDENDDQTQNSLLIKEIIYEDAENDNYSYKDEYFYDGTKIERYVSTSYNNNVLSTTTTHSFTYTNNLIVEKKSTYNQQSTDTYKFSYDTSGRLTQSTYCYDDLSCGNPDRSVFTYSNSNKTITVEEYIEGNLSFRTILQRDTNNNVINVQSTSLANNSIATTTLQYDNFNSPFLHITGATELIVPSTFLTSSGIFAMSNNCVLYQDEEDNYTINYSYDYNDDRYPRQVVLNSGGSYNSNMTLRYVSVNNN